MKSNLVYVTLAFVSVAAGCAQVPDSSVVASDEESLTAIGGATASVAASGAVLLPSSTATAAASPASGVRAATSAERVYVLDAATFPRCASLAGNTGSWKATRLGTTGTIGGFCILEWSGSGAPDASLLPIAAQGDAGKKAYADRPIMAPMSAPTALVDAAWSNLRAGTIAAASATGLPLQSNKSSAFVAVVDSAMEETSTDEASTGSYEHGEVVGRVVRELTGTTGAVAVLSTTALPRNAAGLVQAGGGYYGYTSDTSLAIVRAVGAWRARTARDNVRRPLVINLSLGFDGAQYYGTALGSTALTAYTAANILNLPQRSVFASVQYATCAGALVLAAAGNASEGSPRTDTMTFPAAWEAVPAPTAEQCAALGIASAQPVSAFAASPRMVYAVGGVDGADKNLFNARTNGVPRLLGYGDAVAMSRASTLGGHTGILTGTSMATAVASAAASFAWSFQPAMGAHDVAQAMYDQATSLARVSNACTFGVCTARRVSVCDLARKLSGTAAGCTTIAAGAGAKVKVAVNPLAVGAAYTVAGAAAAVPAATCANSVVAPSVRPMPGSSTCGLCGVSANTAYLNIANPSAALGATISFSGIPSFSFAPTSSYMSIGGLPAGTGTITFTNLALGWTSTEQLIRF